MTNLTVVGRLVARTGQEEALREALRSVAIDSRREPGCLCYDLHVDRDDPGRFLIYETWTGDAALAAHFELAHSRALAARLDELLAVPLAMENLTFLAPEVA